MSTRFIVAAAAAAVYGYFTYDVQGAATVFALVYGATGFLDPAIKNMGPRLEDLRGVKANYGDAFPCVFGHPRVAGVIAWSSQKYEVAQTTSEGKGGPEVENTAFTYKIDLLIVLCEQPGYIPRRSWANGKLHYSAADTADDETLAASGETDQWDEIRTYRGEADQMPDPTYEAAIGAGYTPANRGRSTIMLVGVNCGSSGYPPQFTFEITNAASDEAQGFTENFDDGLDDYTLSGEDEIFEIVAGPALHIIGNTLNPVQSTAARVIPGGIDYTSASFIFKIDPPPDGELDDAIGFEIYSGGVSFQFTPAREDDFDPLRRPVAWFGNNPQPVAGAALEVNRWYRGSFAATDATTIMFTLWDLEEDLLVQETDFTVSSSALNATGIRFFNSSTVVGLYEQQGVTYDEIVIGETTVRVGLAEPGLDDVVSELCVRSGLTTSDIDVTDLASDNVRALGIGQVVAARGTIDALAEIFFFDPVDTGDKIEFRKRGDAAVTTIPFRDLGASVGGQSAESMPIASDNELEVVSEVVITYANVDNDYQDGSERDNRGATAARGVKTIQLPIGLTPTEAKRVVARHIQGVASGLLRVGPITLTKKYSALLPADPIQVYDRFDRLHRLRLMRRVDDSNGVLSFDAVFDDAGAITSTAETNTDYASSEIVRRPTQAQLQIHDIPILRDADDELGQYAAMKWERGTGATLHEDDEVVGGVTRKATMGSALSVLPDWTGGNVFDMVSTVTVSMGNSDLESYTRVQVLDGTALGYAMGAELLYAMTAVEDSPGVWTLSGLLRGQRGTEWATGTHEIGEQVLRLSNDGMLKLQHEVADVGVERTYRAVTSGLRFADAMQVLATDTGVAKKPFAPVDVRAARTAGGIEFTWFRRSRLAMNWLTGSVPLGEESEAYEIDIFDGATLLRTLESTTPQILYSPSDQVADSVTEATNLTATVYQMSADVGRGYGASVETTGGYAGVAQEVEITVGGSFVAGPFLFVFLGGQLFSHEVESGDTDLDGVATAFAATIDASPLFAASAVGPVISVESEAQGAFTVSTQVNTTGAVGTLGWTTQTASDVAPAYGKVIEMAMPPSAERFPAGGYYLNVQNDAVSFHRSYLTLTSEPLYSFEIHSRLATAFLLDPQPETASVSILNFPTHLQFEGPPGAASNGWYASITGGTSFVTQQATDAVLAPRPQISYAVLGGTATTGDQYIVTINGVDYSYTAIGGDDMVDVATGLVSALGAASATVTATVETTPPVGLPIVTAYVRIEGVADALPFTIDSRTVGQITLTANITTPGA